MQKDGILIDFSSYTLERHVEHALQLADGRAGGREQSASALDWLAAAATLTDSSKAFAKISKLLPLELIKPKPLLKC